MEDINNNHCSRCKSKYENSDNFCTECGLKTRMIQCVKCHMNIPTLFSISDSLNIKKLNKCMYCGSSTTYIIMRISALFSTILLFLIIAFLLQYCFDVRYVN